MFGESGEGWFDSYGLVQALLRKAQALDVIGIERKGRRMSGVRADNGTIYPCDLMVNAAGAWSRSIAAMLGIDLPVHARQRSIFNVLSPARLDGCPLLIGPGGIYFRPEERTWICSTSLSADNDPDDLPFDEVDHALFDDVIWPTRAHRVPQFEVLRVKRCWSGYYEYNVLDQKRSLARIRTSTIACSRTVSADTACNRVRRHAA